MPGQISRFMTDDHDRLEALLGRALAGAERAGVDHAAYQEFREGLLRHIGMEEKILLPALARLRDGQPFEHAARLRLDHGAIAALLVPSPTPTIVAALCSILRAHNALEEDPGGLYDASDRVTGTEADALVSRLRSAPPVPLNRHNDSPEVMNATRRALARAGYDLADYQTDGYDTADPPAPLVADRGG